MYADLKRLLVDINVISNFCSLGLAEEDEIFKKKDAANTFLLSKENCELVLANQLALLFQIHLTDQRKVQQNGKEKKTFNFNELLCCRYCISYLTFEYLTSQSWMASMVSKSLPWRI